MKRNMRIALAAASLQLLTASTMMTVNHVAFAEDAGAAPSTTAPTTKEDHEKLAKFYEQEAKTFEEKIPQHEGMEKTYRALHLGGSKHSGMTMENHCKSIVKSYKQAISDNLELAKHHHMMAEQAGK